MKMNNKRGRTFGITATIIGLLVLFIGAMIVITIYGMSGGETFADALETASGSVGDISMKVLYPIFNFALNLSGDTNTNFLMVLSFIMISVIVVGALDSINIFDGGDNKNQILNLVIGIVVSIIGVRFMPRDLWISLTHPASAFVATIMVGIPFIAMVFVSMNLKFKLGRKLLWLFYVLSLIFLISDKRTLANQFIWVYIIFLILGGVMMMFDSSVIGYLHKEKVASALAKGISVESIKRRLEIEKEIKDWMGLKKEARDKTEISDIKAEIARLRVEHKELGVLEDA